MGSRLLQVVLTAASSPIALAPLPPLPTNYPPASGTNAQWRALGLAEGSMLGPNSYQNLSGIPNNTGATAWQNVTPLYFGMLNNGVQPLNLIATALGGLADSRRPDSSSDSLVNSSRIRRSSISAISPIRKPACESCWTITVLVACRSTAGACNASPMMALDSVSNGTPPVDLATLAYDSVSGFNYTAGKSTTAPWYNGGFPLPLSQGPAVGGDYNAYAGGVPKDGYWQAKNTPIITGCIKIEYVAAGAAVGYGRNPASPELRSDRTEHQPDAPRCAGRCAEPIALLAQHRYGRRRRVW